MLIVDAHLDLAMNAMEWNRDLRLPIEAIRRREHGLTDKPDRSRGVVSLPDLRTGNIGLVVATQIARFVSENSTLPGWNSPQQAWAQTQGQLAWYKAMEEAGEMIMITDLLTLNQHIELWSGEEQDRKKPIGFILSLEGADSIVNISYLEKARASGLRIVGPAHYGPGRYANGTDSTGNLSDTGKELLREMDRLDMILDATHLCDDAFWDSLDIFKGPVWASHSNCRSLVDHNRQFSDDQILALIERGAVIGAALDAWMMVPGWVRGRSTPQQMHCNLSVIANHIDHICQLAGNCLHVGIGSDLDGAFGKEQCPADLETIADLQKISPILRDRGYNEADLENIMHGNWLRFLRNSWS